jgi:hypothetical protein
MAECKEERMAKDRERKRLTRALYIRVFGSTRLLRGPERRKYNSKQRKIKKA